MLFSILDYDDDKGAYAFVPNILRVKISSPADSQQVPTGSLQITGNSTDNAQTDCIVSVALNRKLPYQNATATGPDGNNDYSNWSFTFNSSYTTIQPGQNRIAARLTCPEDTTIIKGTHINVTGVPSSADLTQQRQQTTNLPPSPSLSSSTTTTVPLIVPTAYGEEKIIRPFQY
jgi:hypothetical protein